MKKTQEEVAEIMNINHGKQKAYEIGKSRPGILYMDRLVDISGFSQKELLNNKLTEAVIRKRLPKYENEEVDENVARGTLSEAPNLADLPKANSAQPQVDALKDDLIATLKDQIQSHKEQTRFLQRLVETSLVGVSNEVKVVQGQIKGAAAYAALKVAGGDPVKAESEMDEIDKMIADRVQVNVQTGTGVGR